MGAFDSVFAFARGVSSKLGTASKQVLVSFRLFQDGDADDDAEGSSEEPLYGVLGVIVKPRDADADGFPEYVVARRTDNAQPIASRDLRIVNARGNVNLGSVSLAGYGGAFVAIEDTAEKTSSVVMVYVPYPGSPPPKAHALSMDTTEGSESVVLVHGEGHGLVLGSDKIATLKNAVGDCFVATDDAGITLSGDVKLGNNLIVGSPPAAVDGVVLSTQLLLWIGQVNTFMGNLNTLLVTTGLPVTGGGVGAGALAKAASPLTPPAAVPVASAKIKVEPP